MATTPELPENQHVITSGQDKVLDFTYRRWGHPVSFCIDPGVGGTVTCFTSNSPLAVDTPNDPSVIWVPDGTGNITSAAEIVRYAPCKAIKFHAAGATANVHQKG